MSEQVLTVPINYYHITSIGVNTIPGIPPEGTAKLTITGVDGGYAIGTNKEFTVNINPPLPIVQFAYSEGSLSNENNCTVTHNGDIYNITVQVTRSGDPSLPLELNTVYSTNVDSYLDVIVDDFAAGSSTMDIHVNYNTSYMSSAITISPPYVSLMIYPSSSYYVGYPASYYLDLTLPR